MLSARLSWCEMNYLWMWFLLSNVVCNGIPCYLERGSGDSCENGRPQDTLWKRLKSVLGVCVLVCVCGLTLFMLLHTLRELVFDRVTGAKGLDLFSAGRQVVAYVGNMQIEAVNISFVRGCC